MKKFLHLLASFSFALLFGLPLHAQFEITRILGQSSKGLILYSDLSLKNTYLINRCGEIINLWEHENPPGLSARLLKNGHLLRAEYIRGSCCEQVSSGGLIQMLDWDNAVIWQHLVASPSETQHHDFTFLPNGNVAYLGWEAIDEEEQLALGVEDIQPFLWLEFIREVKPIGTDSFELVWEWKMENHLIQDKNPNLPNYRASVKDHLGKIDVNYIGPASYNRRHRWHVNSIEYNEERDEIMVNTRDNSEVWIIDHSTSTEEAASDSGGLSEKGGQLLFRWGNPEAYGRGDIGKLKMYGSHGLVWLDSLSGFRDYILFFNNGDERQGGGGDRSTVEMIKPMIDEEGQYVLDVDSTYLLEDQIIVYGENPQTQPLRSQFLSNAEKLKNGFLINEGNRGRIFQINDQKFVTWELQMKSSRSDVFKAHSYPLDFEGFQNRDLTPINSDNLADSRLCEKTTSTSDEANRLRPQLYPNPTQTHVYIETDQRFELTIRDIHSRIIRQEQRAQQDHRIDIQALETGVYFFEIKIGDSFFVEKVIKI